MKNYEIVTRKKGDINSQRYFSNIQAASKKSIIASIIDENINRNKNGYDEIFVVSINQIY